MLLFQEENLDLSVVVGAYEMARELPRTIYSLSDQMQLRCAEFAFDITVVDNGSTRPADLSGLSTKVPLNTIYIQPDRASKSPVAVINSALKTVTGDVICLMIDGARMASPGLLHWAFRASRMHPRAVILSLGFHLGSKVQMLSKSDGYNQEVEDKLLDSVPWRDDGYKLFDISVLASSSGAGWFRNITESNALFMGRKLWEELNGLDEGFDQAGGGLANLDLLSRAVSLNDVEVYTLLGEGTFHQFHGGVATNLMIPSLDPFFRQYEVIRGAPYAPPSYSTSYIGHLEHGTSKFALV